MESGADLTGFRGRLREFQGPTSLGFNILGADSVGAVFSGCRLHLKAFYLPICFYYYLAKLIIFIRSSRIPCIFFLKGDSRAFIYEKEILPFRMWFQRYEFLKDPPLHFMGEALGILYNQTFFCSAMEDLFIR